MSVLRTPRTVALATLLAAATLPAQIIISEINLTPQGGGDDAWIELVNTTNNSLDISSWSIYYATKTPNQIGNYWFGLPAGTRIGPAAFLRIHWMAPVQPSTTTDIWTGTSVFNFLFGYKPEPLLKGGGAVALMNTQDNNQMNNPASIQDWVSWGSSGFLREDLAVQGGKWIAADFVTAPLQSDSIAINYNSGEPTPASAFFHDATPTPLAHNHPGAGVSAYGTPCAVGTAGTPGLGAVSIPTEGNRDFGFVVTGTSLGENLVLVFSAGQGNGSVMLGPCAVWVDPNGPLVSLSLPAQAVQTKVAVPLVTPGTAGGTIYVQAFTIVSPIDFGFSGGLLINLGA